MNRKIFEIISLLLIFITFLFIPRFLINNVGDTPYQYIFKPLLFIVIALFTFVFIRKKYEVSNVNKKALRQMAIIGSLIYMIMYYLIGLLIGYSTSPFNHSILGILSNVFPFVIVAIAEEVIRSNYIKAAQENRKYINIFFVTFLLTILNIGISNFKGAFDSTAVMMVFLLKYFFPSLITSMFLSYLTYREGIISSLLYKIPFLLVYLISPVFPANNYAIICIIHSFVPLFIYFKIEKEYFSYIKFNIKERFSGFEKVKFLIFIFFIVLVTSFTAGIYPIKPVVIITGSMDPIIKRGDVVIYQKINYNDIEIGDIIVYNLDSIKVIHRVIDIQNASQYGEVLITKGDNNETRDSASVLSNQVLGIVIAVIPKIGFPTIMVNELLSNNESVEIETGN